MPVGNSVIGVKSDYSSRPSRPKDSVEEELGEPGDLLLSEQVLLELAEGGPLQPRHVHLRYV